MKISGSKKLFTLYKKDLAAFKSETLLILGFIVVGNLFLFYRAKTSWPVDMSLALSMLFLGFVPLYIFFRAFGIIREEWKANTVYFMMSLPTTGNIIFLSKLLALLTQFFMLGIVAIASTTVFVLMKTEIQQIWMVIRDIGNMHQIVWEIVKASVTMFLSFIMVIITAFFSAVVGKMFKRFSGLITFVIFIATNYVTTGLTAKIIELINKSGLDFFSRKEIMLRGIVSVQFLSNSFFVFTVILSITVSILLFLATTTIYDKKVEI